MIFENSCSDSWNFMQIFWFDKRKFLLWYLYFSILILIPEYFDIFENTLILSLIFLKLLWYFHVDILLWYYQNIWNYVTLKLIVLALILSCMIGIETIYYFAMILSLLLCYDISYSNTLKLSYYFDTLLWYYASYSLICQQWSNKY